ncbi:MAG: T9SS type A sorting domain-containing protein, partial [Bacteroidales bacterium]|nr:T9SS type A sorting domain-containing protein [Bacteroidales bacterium]
ETRFRLHFSKLDPEFINQNNVSIYANGDIIYIYTPEILNGDIVIYDILGQQIAFLNTLNEGLNTIKVSNGTGYYLVKVQANGEFISEKVFIR